MTVQELIEELSKIRDKTQKVMFYDVEAKVDECGYESFNSVRETWEDGQDLVVLEWED
ncbi:hypothetical protein [Alkalihalobacillus sp. BA299]|uniref:hypothetical protein n=1 Tax=Alkalihalobacillus sp. BA299 TaxID=2815938 RepID=UPI001ADB368D|nr:hypothetical protein [Alkalihalobacillus sp. BA299]